MWSPVQILLVTTQMTVRHHCTEAFIFTLASSWYDLDNIERGVKHQIITISYFLMKTYCFYSLELTSWSRLLELCSWIHAFLLHSCLIILHIVFIGLHISFNTCHVESVKMPCPLPIFSHLHFTWSMFLIPIHILNEKQCKSRSVGQLIWTYTVKAGYVRVQQDQDKYIYISNS